MATLKTNYKDDILDTSVNTQRKYRMVNNADGTISLEDVTVYTQNGDSFGAADINKTNQAVLDLNSSLSSNKIRNLLLPNGEYIYQGPLYVVNNEYACFTINLPYVVDTSEISIIEFRPGSQTVINDNNPNVFVNGNQILIRTSVSGFFSYNGKECIAKIKINIPS